MKEQNEYDQMPSSLLDQLQRILPLADKVADEIVSEETEVLEKIMPQMFEVMQKIANFLCDYVKRGHLSRRCLFWILQLLMIAERTGAALFSSKDKVSMKEMDEELANVIKHFLNAVDVETLCLARRIGRHSLSQYRMRPFSVALCRAGVSTQSPSTYQDRLSPGPLLHGRHPQNSARGNHELGGK